VDGASGESTEKEVDPPCDLLNVTDANPDCQQQASRWALGQVSAVILSRSYGLLFLAGGTGAWIFFLVVVRWRREERQWDFDKRQTEENAKANAG
jgi:hypothetical protein